MFLQSRLPITLNLDNKKSIKYIFVIPLAILLVMVCLFTIAIIITTYRDYSYIPSFKNSLVSYYSTESSTITDKNNKIIFDYRQRTKKENLKLQDIPKSMQAAMLVREDENFYSSAGLSWKNLTGALVGCIKSKVTGVNDDCRGGSGIYQQLIKNYENLPTRNTDIKYQELLKSIRLSEDINPDAALEMYLNNMDFGRLSRGVQIGSQSFFGHNVQDDSFNPSKACFLAIMPNQPSGFTMATRNMLNNTPDQDTRPTYKWSYVKALVNNCLEKLSKVRVYPNQSQFLSEKESTEWKNYNLESAIKDQAVETNAQAKYYIKDYIEEELLNKFPQVFPDSNTLNNYLINQPLVIQTTFDLDVQNKLEQSVADNNNQLRIAGVNQFSSVILDTTNSNMVALLGNLDYSKSQLNRLSGRYGYINPGSSIKPYFYAGVLNKGFNPSTILQDGRYIDPVLGNVRSNDNVDKYQGNITLRYALQQSTNTVAEQIAYLNQEPNDFAYKTGVKNSTEFASRLGLSYLKDRTSDQCLTTILIAIGNCPVLGISHANAMATLANNGVKNEIQSIKSITLKSQTLGDNLNSSKPVQVIDASIAQQTMNILSDYATRRDSNGSRAADADNMELKNWTGPNQIASKSGTAQITIDNINKNGELTVIGASPYYTTLIWGANIDDQNSYQPTLTAATGITPIYKSINESIHQGLTPKPFPTNNLKSVKLNPKTGLIDNDSKYQELLNDKQIDILSSARFNSYNTIFENRTTVNPYTCTNTQILNVPRFIELNNYMNNTFKPKC
jgi:membrane peptidoglycan carboxypeptidase